MTYTPAGGWLEPSIAAGDGRALRYSVFHGVADCPKVLRPAELRPVDKPYTARRCRRCGRV